MTAASRSLRSAAEELRGCLCLQVRMTARSLSKAYDKAMRPMGLRTTQLSVLAAIEKFGPLSFQNLAEMLALDKTTLPRNLEPLRRAGLVRFGRGEDRRERHVFLTEKGQQKLREAFGAWRGVQGKMMKRLGSERIRALRTNLMRLRVMADV